ncbi:potassium channel family protein [Phragmitibacter flavus]|uniref:Potassium channel family protein n=1 Tax=Phragmitibacter flavus TaxID=2576071 RepID=A0A5R8KIX2_9BACT|nr:potassium channel family protein [Phragmitibacter flavus]TLD72263.1 potassium channel family protein [Phragmitibacter flavus]
MALRKLYFGLGLFVFIILASTFGYWLAGWPWLDALYMVVITVFGVGFGEVRPIDTVGLRVFTMLVIVADSTAVVYIIGSIVRIITEGEIRRSLGMIKMKRSIEELQSHAILCGYGRIGQILAKELAASKHPFVVVDIDAERLAAAEALGYLTLRGSAMEEECLISAGIERAKVLATVLPQDTLNVFITLTARNLNRSIRIMARGEQPSTEKKLRQAGADEVVLPSSIGAHRFANSIIRPSVMQFLGDPKGLVGQELKYLGLEVDELSIQHDASFEGMKIRDIQQKTKNSFLVVALKCADGRIMRDHFADHHMVEGDAMIVLGRSADMNTSLSKASGVERNELL